MKKAANEPKLKEGAKMNTPVKSQELKTDSPISEKDEVKQAETNMRERRKHIL
ncbi:hypothetical protein [Mucilaginibacter xinganensis]|uniref:Uncharacterized protein n=1 Tax=Mucilaginibacter xinganensis TaxID=1234841 RepID=A0A223NV51_9SPHI|nr:hypothetical protein [Mucilaginibacter xinganensis]ASU33401.1 hypothetical protein MuYL_1503 [Mucilaginibacter xinganensis]